MKTNTLIKLSIMLLALNSTSILSMRPGIQKIITRSLIIPRIRPDDGSLASLLHNRALEIGIFPDSIIGKKYKVLECYPPRYTDQITSQSASQEEVDAYLSKTKYEILQQKCPNIPILKPTATFNQAYAWIEKNYQQVNNLLIEKIEEDKAWIDGLNESITTYVKLCRTVNSSQWNGRLASWACMDPRNDFSLRARLMRTWWHDGIIAIRVKSNAISPESLDRLLAFKEGLAILQANFNRTVEQALKPDRREKKD